MAHKKVVVVGGGLAGLAAATYLARGGASVTLLEKAHQPGGRAITDTPHGYALDRGAHAIYTGGPASDVLRELHIRYASGSPRNIFALDSSGLHPFPSDAFRLFRTNALGPGDKPELIRVLLRISRLRPAGLAGQSVADFIAELTTHRRIRQIIASLARVYTYSNALDIVSADVFVWRLQQTLRYPVHYVEGGWQTIVDRLAEAAITVGVQVRTSAPVSTLSIHNGLAHGVRFRDGSQLECTHVVLALPPADALKILGQEASHLQQIVRDTLPAPIACLDIALSRLPAREHPVVFNLEKSLFATAQSEFIKLAPEGGAVVHVLKQLDPRAPTDADSDRTDMEAFMDRIQPGWQDVALERRFLPHMLGSSALPLVSTGGLAGRLAHESRDVPNVYFAGDWIGPRGFLLDTVLDSARVSARMILQDASSLAQAA